MLCGMILESAMTHQTDRSKLRSASISIGDFNRGILPLIASDYMHQDDRNTITEAAWMIALSHDTRKRYDSSGGSSEASFS